MLELSVENAGAYVPQWLGPGPWSISGLGGGVSNVTLLAENGGRRVVLKQALGRLRVREDWFADRTRIYRECAAVRALAQVLPAGSVPEVVFEDRDNFIFGMTAAPAAARDWKTCLLGGEIDAGVAAAVGAILAAQIRGSWRSPAWRAEFGDQRSFDQLRLDPYYRFTAAKHPGLAAAFQACIDHCQSHACCAVHGDFSPKNLLVGPSGVTLIDFEVIHFGDPAFDSAFLLNHLLLKARHRPEQRAAFAGLAESFWQAVTAGVPGDAPWFEEWTIRHLGCLHLARVDGKSPAEYLSEETRTEVRRRACVLIAHPPGRVLEAFAE